MKRCAIYARFSSQNQKELSIDSQILACEEYAKKRGYEIEDYFIDRAISGRNTEKRLKFLDMNEKEKNGEFECIITHKYDRFSRNTADTLSITQELKDYNVAVESVIEDFEDNAEEDLLKTVISGLNEYYSKNLSREVMKTMKLLAGRGVHVSGTPPLGYIVLEDRTYGINEIEAEAVKLIFNMYVSGHTHPQIIKELNNQGYENKRGESFTKNSLLSLLTQEKYRGCYIWNKTAARNSKGKRNSHKYKDESQIIRIEGGMPRIISDELFYRAKEIMKERSYDGKLKKTSSKYLLSSMVRCSCGFHFHGNPRRSKRKNGIYEYVSYRCGGRKQKSTLVCNVPEIRDIYLEEFVIGTLKNLLFREENKSYLIELLNNRIKKENEQLEYKVELLQGKYKKIEKEIANLIKAIGKANEVEELLEALEQKKKEKNEVFQEISTMKSMDKTSEIDEEFLNEISKELCRESMYKNLYVFKSLLLKIVKEITVGKEEISLVMQGINFFDKIAIA